MRTQKAQKNTQTVKPTTSPVSRMLTTSEQEELRQWRKQMSRKLKAQRLIKDKKTI